MSGGRLSDDVTHTSYVLQSSDPLNPDNSHLPHDRDYSSSESRNLLTLHAFELGLDNTYESTQRAERLQNDNHVHLPFRNPSKQLIHFRDSEIEQTNQELSHSRNGDVNTHTDSASALNRYKEFTNSTVSDVNELSLDFEFNVICDSDIYRPRPLKRVALATERKHKMGNKHPVDKTEQTNNSSKIKHGKPIHQLSDPPLSDSDGACTSCMSKKAKESKKSPRVSGRTGFGRPHPKREPDEPKWSTPKAIAKVKHAKTGISGSKHKLADSSDDNISFASCGSFENTFASLPMAGNIAVAAAAPNAATISPEIQHTGKTATTIPLHTPPATSAVPVDASDPLTTPPATMPLPDEMQETVSSTPNTVSVDSSAKPITALVKQVIATESPAVSATSSQVSPSSNTDPSLITDTTKPRVSAARASPQTVMPLATVQSASETSQRTATSAAIDCPPTSAITSKMAVTTAATADKPLVGERDVLSMVNEGKDEGRYNIIELDSPQDSSEILMKPGSSESNVELCEEPSKYTETVENISGNHENLTDIGVIDNVEKYPVVELYISEDTSIDNTYLESEFKSPKRLVCDIERFSNDIVDPASFDDSELNHEVQQPGESMSQSMMNIQDAAYAKDNSHDAVQPTTPCELLSETHAKSVELPMKTYASTESANVIINDTDSLSETHTDFSGTISEQVVHPSVEGSFNVDPPDISDLDAPCHSLRDASHNKTEQQQTNEQIRQTIEIANDETDTGIKTVQDSIEIRGIQIDSLGNLIRPSRLPDSADASLHSNAFVKNELDMSPVAVSNDGGRVAKTQDTEPAKENLTEFSGLNLSETAVISSKDGNPISKAARKVRTISSEFDDDSPPCSMDLLALHSGSESFNETSSDFATEDEMKPKHPPSFDRSFCATNSATKTNNTVQNTVREGRDRHDLSLSEALMKVEDHPSRSEQNYRVLLDSDKLQIKTIEILPGDLTKTLKIDSHGNMFVSEEEVKKVIRFKSLTFPKMGHNVPDLNAITLMLEELHSLSPTKETAPSLGQATSLSFSPLVSNARRASDQTNGTSIKTTITDSDIDESEPRDGGSTDDADDEDDESNTEVLFCKSYANPDQTGGEIVLSCTIVNSALRHASSDEFWADEPDVMSSDDAFQEVQKAADAVTKHFDHARAQMHDIQYHLESLRHQMEDIESQVQPCEFFSSDDLHFNNPRHRPITD